MQEIVSKWVKMIGRGYGAPILKDIVKRYPTNVIQKILKTIEEFPDVDYEVIRKILEERGIILLEQGEYVKVGKKYIISDNNIRELFSILKKYIEKR